jgi:hypothetical protein
MHINQDQERNEMQTIVRVALGTFIGLWAFVISLLVIGRLFGTALLDLVL